MVNPLIIVCIILWGICTFLNRLSVERMPSILMQVIVGIAHIAFIPIALKLAGNMYPNYKWSMYSILLTLLATSISILANVLLYFSLKGNNNGGQLTMLLSLYPTVTLILSVVFLNEQLTINKIAGILTMIVGAILLSW